MKASEARILSEEYQSVKNNASAKLHYDRWQGHIKEQCQKGLFTMSFSDRGIERHILEILIRAFKDDGYKISHKPGGSDCRGDSWDGTVTIEW